VAGKEFLKKKREKKKKKRKKNGLPAKIQMKISNLKLLFCLCARKHVNVCWFVGLFVGWLVGWFAWALL
jgi:cell division septal protein FtsQ